MHKEWLPSHMWSQHKPWRENTYPESVFVRRRSNAEDATVAVLYGVAVLCSESLLGMGVPREPPESKVVTIALHCGLPTILCSCRYSTFATPRRFHTSGVGAPTMGCSRSTPQGVPTEACGGPDRHLHGLITSPQRYRKEFK